MTTEEIKLQIEKKNRNLYDPKYVDVLPMLSYADALVDFTTGACHMLAYQMIQLLPKDSYRVGFLADHCFIVDVRNAIIIDNFVDWDDISTCYDIDGSHDVEDFKEKWCDDEEKERVDIITYDKDQLDYIVDLANDLYLEDITPNTRNWVMKSAKYWAKKMVKAMKAGATNELYEQVQEHKYSMSEINFDEIVKKHLKSCRQVA